MKNLFLILFIFIFTHENYSQAIINKPAFSKSIIDFGAIPNDGKDDTWAFIKAGKYFSNEWDINGVPLKKGRVNLSYVTHSGKLVINPGEYQVGRQITVPSGGLNTTYGKVFGYPAATAPLSFDAGNAFKAGLEIISLQDVDQFMITGMGSTAPVIKYNNGLVIGYFNNKGEPMWFPASAYDGKYCVNIGNFLSVINCKNISVENLSVDGNNIPSVSGGKTVYNGGWASDLIQMGASGLYLLNTKNVSLTKLNIHHMTLDGIVFQDYYKDTITHPGQPLSNLLISDTKCDYNRRQGFSWVGGRKVSVINSSFNHTGTTVNGIASGNPGAGVDIEPEADGINLLYCIDGIFANCEFINNRGCALVNDESALRSRNMKFFDCIFHDVDGYSVWVKGRSFIFKNCKIWGGFVYGNNGEVPGEETRFYNCDFADEEMPGKKGIYNAGYALIESWQSACRLFFADCTFRTLHDKQRLAAIYTRDTAENKFSVFSNCSFTASNGNAINVLFGCIFDGNTSIIKRGKQVETFLLNGLIFKGSSNAGKSYNFNLDGNIMFQMANSNGPGLTQFIIGRSSTGKQNLGYLKFTIGPQSCVYGYWNQTIDIGKNSTFINKGQLAILSGNINLEGKLNLEAGSHSAFFHPINFNSGNKTAQINYQNSSSFGIGETWKKGLEGLGGGLPLSAHKINTGIKLTKGLK
ncbi:MAG: right-handed parallel beta-helix repeat-containing protein [Ferruginibacter sp.]